MESSESGIVEPGLKLTQNVGGPKCPVGVSLRWAESSGCFLQPHLLPRLFGYRNRGTVYTQCPSSGLQELQTTPRSLGSAGQESCVSQLELPGAALSQTQGSLGGGSEGGGVKTSAEVPR